MKWKGVVECVGTGEDMSLLEVGKGYHSYRLDGHDDREPGTSKCLEVRHCSVDHWGVDRQGGWSWLSFQGMRWFWNASWRTFITPMWKTTFGCLWQCWWLMRRSSYMSDTRDGVCSPPISKSKRRRWNSEKGGRGDEDKELTLADLKPPSKSRDLSSIKELSLRLHFILLDPLMWYLNSTLML